jgi:hypothetical protein
MQKPEIVVTPACIILKDGSDGGNARSDVKTVVYAGISRLIHIFGEYLPHPINTNLLACLAIAIYLQASLFTISLMFVMLVVFNCGFGLTFLIVTAKRNVSRVRTFFRFLSASGFVQKTAKVSSYPASWWFEGNIDAPMGSVIAKTCFERRVFCFLQLQDGRILTGHIDGTLQVSDLLSLNGCRAGDVIIRAHPSPVNAIVQLRDGRVVSSSSFSIYMKLWDMDSLTCLKRIEMPELSFMSLHNVRSLVELSDGTLLREKSDLHPQLGNGQPITTLSGTWLPDGAYPASYCRRCICFSEIFYHSATAGSGSAVAGECSPTLCCCWRSDRRWRSAIAT